MSANYFFSITEIAREICLTLEDDKESLFHLALCDKAISETALDVLWMNMNSLRPFMPFIPKGLSEVNVSSLYSLGQKYKTSSGIGHISER
ncbi:hypothetical protein HYDPIDRAFT_108806 [Hydnomerulius pinastri MD-312]|nr:hypothetical protein HYDPIDRAFT_108806 [Hydnomerulius pinastri MD-312]